MDFTLSYEADEQKVINACIRHERWAQKRLYEQYFGQMIGICMRYSATEDEAKDLVHDGFLKVFSGIGKYRRGTSMGAWMRKVMINTCIDAYRKHQCRRTETLAETGSMMQTHDDPLDIISENDILSAIQKLPDTYRTVFNLFVVEGFSHREISEILSITESTSRANLVKARIRLRELLQEIYPSNVRSK